MPISKYDSAFGGKRGAASEALAAMIRQYGQKEGTRVFYATKNRNVGRKKKRPLHAAIDRAVGRSSR